MVRGHVPALRGRTKWREFDLFAVRFQQRRR
jgi:hypothetical protein